MNPPNLVHMKYFCDAVRLGSLSAASQINFVTQSAISQGISKLEMCLGIQLVAHHPNRFRLTPEGEAVFHQAMDILKKTMEFQHHFSKDVDYMGVLELACSYSFGISFLPHYLKRFRETYPKSQMSFQLDRKEVVKKMVNQGTVDFGVLPDDGTLHDFDKRDVYVGKFKCYVRKNERKKMNVFMGKFKKDEKFLFEELLSKKGITVMEVSSWELIGGLVGEGMGIGYMPEYSAIGKSFKDVDLGLEQKNHHICAISLRGMQLRKSSQAFLDLFKK